MARKISIGRQDYATMREKNCFFIDKTRFIQEWWEADDDITLITRPRRFGKTLNMSMLNCFFSNRYADRNDLFEGLYIWENEQYRDLQGTYPVIFLSFASVKADNVMNAKKQIKAQITEIYHKYESVWKNDNLNEKEKEYCWNLGMNSDDAEIALSIRNLCDYLMRFYGKKTILLLDEYDTPLQEAYEYGYWEELTSFIRNFFNATFKTNPYLERAVMTGITRISKESVFSDLNNLRVVTTTSSEYAEDFGFTQEEVYLALEEMGLIEWEETVKQWYDGFTFGNRKDIYNPWSITNFLKEKKVCPYWASTSSNKLVSHLLQRSSIEVKECMEKLLHRERIIVTFDEQIVFDQLDQQEGAIWSLLVASGYLKVEKIEYRGEIMEPWYHLSITNRETEGMFQTMFREWFGQTNTNYNRFVQVLLQGDLEAMNVYMNDIAISTFSYFDVGGSDGRRMQPEKFYHGFVLGLLAELREEYELRSNQESGFGRYDVMLLPKESGKNAIIIEFKVQRPETESSLEATVKAALQQIHSKKYKAQLHALGYDDRDIKCYGFAFQGKKVLIGEAEEKNF